jgi:hypothetical protein
VEVPRRAARGRVLRRPAAPHIETETRTIVHDVTASRAGGQRRDTADRLAQVVVRTFLDQARVDRRRATGDRAAQSPTPARVAAGRGAMADRVREAAPSHAGTTTMVVAAAHLDVTHHGAIREQRLSKTASVHVGTTLGGPRAPGRVRAIGCHRDV